MMSSIPVILNPIYKDKILNCLENFLQKKSKEFLFINSWGKDIQKRILEFVMDGKMLRGSLVFFSYSLFSENREEDIVKVASAIELFHSSLLAHDDIMDQDEERRGKPSIFTQYNKLAQEKNFENSLHFGESMGICFGDISFFLAYELLSDIRSKEVTKFLSKELSFVVLAQMQDIYNGFSTETVTKEEILHLYRYKTGRYTFSAPLALGALLANQNQDTVTSLEKTGELLGIQFQLKDDELGLFGSKKGIGKPLGSDIRENKKTIYRLLLFQKASREQNKKLKEIFGKEQTTENDLAYIYDLCKQSGIIDEVQKIGEDIEEKTKHYIQALPITEKNKKIFFNLLLFNKEREK